jgi:hypothetical protein
MTAREALLKQRADDREELASVEADIARCRADRSMFGMVPLDLRTRERDLRAGLQRVERDLAAAGDQDAAAMLATAAADRRFAHERAEFWFRRFFTSLGVANGAAFAAISAGLLQAQKPEEIAPLVFGPLVVFAFGTVTAGLVPFALYLQSAAASGVLEPTPRAEAIAQAVGRQGVAALTLLSVVALVGGVAIALVGVQALAVKGAHRPPPTRPQPPPVVQRPPPAAALAPATNALQRPAQTPASNSTLY